MVLWKNYGTMEKNYVTIPKIMALWFTKEKNMVDYQKLWNFDLHRKKLWLYTKTIEVFEHIYSLRTLIYYGKNMVSTL